MHIVRRQSQPRTAIIHLLGNNLSLDGFDPLMRRHRLKQRASQVAVFKHMAHRAFFQLTTLEMQEKRRWPLPCAAIACLDLVHRLCVLRHLIPKAQTLQKSDRSEGQSIGPSIKRCIRTYGFRLRINDAHTPPPRGQSQRQNGAV